MVVVLLISVLGVCVARATPPKSGSNEYVAWYVYVYDVRWLSNPEETNSSHYFKVRRRGSKNVSGSWEFAHKIRRRRVIGSGAVVPGKTDTITGSIGLTRRKTSQQKRDHRGVTYSDMAAGQYYIEAYTSVSLLVDGKNKGYAKVTDTVTFTIGGP